MPLLKVPVRNKRPYRVKDKKEQAGRHEEAQNFQQSPFKPQPELEAKNYSVFNNLL